MTTRLSRNRFLWALGVMAVAGLSVFVFLLGRSVTVERAAPNEALRRFDQVESRLRSHKPMFRVDANGAVTRRQSPSGEPQRLSTLQALAYRGREERLVHASVPFWFLKMKGPAVQYSLRGTGFDLDRLGVTPADLERFFENILDAAFVAGYRHGRRRGEVK